MMACLNRRLNWHYFVLVFFIMGLSGCTSIQRINNNRVEIIDNTFVSLPSPESYGHQLIASQLITANWQDNKGSKVKKYSEQLPVQLQVTSQQVALAGFSSWGSRILSLTYDQDKLDTYVLPGLGNTLPKPQQVLFNLMLTLWPAKAWDSAFSNIGWQLKDSKHRRQLFDNHGNLVIDIHYSSINPLKGDIYFSDKRLNYQIKITTLSYELPS